MDLVIKTSNAPKRDNSDKDLPGKKRKIVAENDSSTTQPTTSRTPETPQPIKIKTKNRYENLPIETNDIEMLEDELEYQKKEKLRKPPPIVMHGICEKHLELVKTIKGKIKANFHVKYTKENTNIYFEEYEDFQTMKNYFIITNQLFHTFTPRNEKTHAFVLRGLENPPELEEIEEELCNKHKIPLKNIFKMKGTRAPMYLVITNSSITLKALQQQVKVISYTKIQWERYTTTKEIIQCHRCQHWGHATSNCYGKITCLKCSENHLTRDCTKTLDTPAKCANCHENHPANSSNCKVYQKIIQKKQEKAESQPQMRRKIYTPAPPPAHNVWEIRKKQHQGTQENQENQPPKPNIQLTHSNIEHNQGNDANPLFDIKNEFDRLNQHINIIDFLENLKTLNDKLDHITNPTEKFTLFYKFITALK